MRYGVVVVAGLIVAAGAQAQTGTMAPMQSGATSTKQATRYVVVGQGCPGQLSARPATAGGATVWTTALEDQDKKGRAPSPGSMGVHVEFDGAKTQVHSAELSVRYLPLGLRVMPVTPDVNAKGSQESKKKTFSLTAEEKTRIEGNLMVGPASMIESVHLTSATFADGGVWRAPSDSACTVAPERLILVNTK